MEIDDVRLECRVLCGAESTCVSINIGPPANDGFSLCQLSNSDHIRHPDDLKPQEGFLYWATQNPCSSGPCFHNATCLNGFTDKRYICLCQDGYNGENCEIVPFSGFNAVFTNLGASGRNGPKSLGNYYTGQDHGGQVQLSGGIQQWTVPYTGEYKIEAIGATGGYVMNSEYQGRGARMIGTFHLFKGELIQILVGHEGRRKSKFSSVGGGGTFVVRGSNTPLIIAGGGGGIQEVQSRHAGCDANASTTGNPGYKSWSGGSGGHGAQVADNPSGGGGGGFYSNGRNGNKSAIIAKGGQGFLQGGKGGNSVYKNLDGGFGGGGACLPYGGGSGGGGGYSGGSSGSNGTDSCGGGGGSYNVGTNQENECCFNAAGHGYVTITFL
ncbi:uncharacterized protein LOC144664745 isoform X1 [Oculina patagonica]